MALVFRQLHQTSSSAMAQSQVMARRSLHLSLNTAAVHNDIQFPNFDSYRNEMTANPTQPSHVTEEARKGVPNFIFYGVGGALSVMAAKVGIQKVINYKWMPRDMAAMAATEIDLSLVPVGKTKTFEWRGKPVFVKHRTAKEIARERAVDVAKLRHPEKDEDRVQKPEWSILIGVCTHLGCIPLSGKGDFGGYFCPCHGSHYDASGRIRKGPAPLNLEVPKYEFVSDTLIKVGSD